MYMSMYLYCSEISGFSICYKVEELKQKSSAPAESAQQQQLKQQQKQQEQHKAKELVAFESDDCVTVN